MSRARQDTETAETARPESAAPDALALRLHGHVQRLATGIGERNVWRPDALYAAADYIRSVWTSQGLTVEGQRYTVEDVESENLEVTLPGTGQPEAILLVGAHYDTVPGSPGADDNASGVAALLELPGLLAGRQRNLTLRFVAFVNEEPPFFFTANQGSRVHARAARRRGDDIRLMISLEMLGCYCDTPGCQRYPPLFRYFHPPQGNFIAFVSNLRSRRAMRRFARAFRRHSDFPCEQTATFAWVPGVGWSDHLSYWLHRYRAMMITDTAFYRYPCYHLLCDTPEKLDYRRMARVTRGVADALAELAVTGI